MPGLGAAAAAGSLGIGSTMPAAFAIETLQLEHGFLAHSPASLATAVLISWLVGIKTWYQTQSIRVRSSFNNVDPTYQ